MKRVFLKQSILVGIAMVGVTVAVPLVAGALPARAEESQTTHQERQTTLEDQRGAVHTRLADARLKACKSREETIASIMTRLGERGQKHLNLFSTIAERTEKFYTEKGKTLDTYNTLVADVAAKKAAAQEAVDTVKSTSVEFKCDGENPRGVAAAFKESLKSERAALKEYKTSVKNLIVGVKSVQGATSSADNEGTR